MLLKGKDCHGSDGALLSAFPVIFMCVCVFECVFEHTLGHKCVVSVCVCVCACCAECVTISKGMRDLENMPETQIFHESSFTLKELSLLIYTF